MAYILRSGISFCEASGRLVFLDLPRDRYICLERQAETVFRETVMKGAGRRGDPALEMLVRQGILARAERPQERSRPPALVPAKRSALDCAASIKPAASAILRAAAAMLGARYSLHRRGLAETLDRLARLSSGSRPIPGGAKECCEIAAAFARLDLYLSPLDQCLPRSIALASILARRRIAARLVIAVRLRPFLAHSWVQAGDLAINDRPDVVRTFTPILVI